MQTNRQFPQGRDGSTTLSQRSGRQDSLLATHTVLRNTYFLLSATLLFSALTAGISMTFSIPHPGLVLTLVGYFGLLFLTSKFRNSSLGLVFVFALTGFMGMTLGPILSFYMQSMPNGGQLIFTALASTGLMFFGLSTYVLTTRKDMSFMGGFLLVGLIGMVAVILISFFVDLSAFQMAISAGIVLLMGGMILYQTSAIIHGGEQNYIMATVSLFVSIYNIFINLLMLFGMGGDD